MKLSLSLAKSRGVILSFFKILVGTEEDIVCTYAMIDKLLLALDKKKDDKFFTICQEQLDLNLEQSKIFFHKCLDIAGELLVERRMIIVREQQAAAMLLEAKTNELEAKNQEMKLQELQNNKLVYNYREMQYSADLKTDLDFSGEGEVILCNYAELERKKNELLRK